ncbi:MAG TPA: hypothetical protein VD837_07640 [Terriglobales bacterium]|nr:hypothetical protein [Terriglobales bacterium]
MSIKVVIIAALEREVAPLVKGWRVLDNSHSGVYRTFQHGDTTVVCSGIGFGPAQKCAESAISILTPQVVVSAGLAGALVPEMKVGQVLVPATIVNSRTGARINTGHGSGTLVSAAGIAGPEGKRLLAHQHSGLAVDMEAAAVAEVAEGHKIGFTAVKAISDDADFPVPDLERFVDDEGRFLTGKFVAHVGLHPRLWGTVRQFALNSAHASQELCRVLRNLIESGKWQVGPKSVRPAATIEGIRVP